MSKRMKTTLPIVETQLGIVETDADRGAPACTADMREGVSCQHALDTEYENFAEHTVQNPRSDVTHYDGPAPREVGRHRHLFRYL